ncbi:hypothetical protein N0V90_005215 [Kalmusia sp. IMI 367209]|nr:hypothetical protein N0V90_005215 [Kalmusia sp. IMI 367209]
MALKFDVAGRGPAVEIKVERVGSPRNQRLYGTGQAFPKTPWAFSSGMIRLNIISQSIAIGFPCGLGLVTCDEQRPKCTACRKRDRECTYSFGKVSAFVVEDPTQLSKHGKPKIAPVIYPLDASHESSATSTTISSSSTLPASSALSSTILRQISIRDADSGHGEFMTLSIPTREKPKGVKKTSAQQRRKLQIHLGQLQDAKTLPMPRQLVSIQTALAYRYLNLLGSRPTEEQPFSILGSWIQSIPSRIGISPAVDLAVEYLIHSFNVFQEPSFSAQRMALSVKAKALKALQMVVADESTRTTYDTAIAMKLHFMSEIFMGIKNLYHAIHSAGLSDILQAGPVTGLDDDHYWSFLDNTYIDDVSEAMVASRTSVYDHELYLSMTCPAAIPYDAPAAFRASIAIMHVYIQLPRLVCLIRHASNYPEDAQTLASAIALAESLWSLVPNDVIQEVIQTSITVVDRPPSPDIADITSYCYHFDSIQSCILITRFWMLQINLCGPIQTLYQNFPAESTASLLPPLLTVEQIDYDAAIELARSIRYALDICPTLPLVPLRIYTSFQVSIGTWHRMIRRINANNRALSPDPSSPVAAYLAEQLSRAQRLENWVSSETNDVHEMWKVQRVHKRFLRSAAIDMAGGPIPDWMPLRIKFESEDGAMVMRLEYDVAGPLYDQIVGNRDGDRAWVRRTKTISPFHPETNGWVPSKGISDGDTRQLLDRVMEKPRSGEGSDIVEVKEELDSREKKYAEDLTCRPVGKIPPLSEGTWAESDEEDDGLQKPILEAGFQS